MSFIKEFLQKSTEVIQNFNESDIESLVNLLVAVRENGGRLFLLGSGGGAGHSSHAACDFRKLCNIEAYAPYDNVSELTARVNDEGWDVTLVNWLKVSRLNAKDCLLIFSVGGGSEKPPISMNLVNAAKYAKQVGAKIAGVVGKDGGYTKQVGDAVVVVPAVQPSLVTPLTEGFQALVWHLIVSHPRLQLNTAKWESCQPLVQANTSGVAII